MKGFIFILVCLLMSCTGTNHVRNAELTAEYYGVVEVRKGGAYIDEATLRQLVKQDDKTHYIVFSDDMCARKKGLFLFVFSIFISSILSHIFI